MRRLWVTVAVTDRSDALAPMVDDLVRQTQQANVELSLFIVENSRAAPERKVNGTLFNRLLATGVEVDYTAQAPFGRSIAQSRRRQREWVKCRLQRESAPDAIWMLDDDNRLDHLTHDGTLLVRPLEHHVTRLMAMARQPDRPDLLIGTVTGDPPIPAAATIASRAVDVAANLQALFDAQPGDASGRVLASLRVVGEFDDYYDLSHERAVPTWEVPCRWLTQSVDPSVQETAHELLREALLLGSGVALTRPILTRTSQLDEQWTGYRRGGNAVFFNPEACLDHAYPSLELCGVQTRRGDMIGAYLLGRSYTVVTSGFSVRHCRARRVGPMTQNGFETSLLADNLGACLARAVSAHNPVGGASAFLHARLASIQAAMCASQVALGAILALMADCPEWIEPEAARALAAHVALLREALPLVEGGLTPTIVEAMTCDTTAARIGEEALRLRAQLGESQ
jgi:hypothetical protein